MSLKNKKTSKFYQFKRKNFTFTYSKAIGNNKMIQTQEPDKLTKMPYGIHEGVEIDDLIESDIPYCLYIYKQSIIKNVYHTIYDKLHEQFHDYSPETLTFGKYKGMNIHDVYKKNKSYIKFLAGLSNYQFLTPEIKGAIERYT